jgi:hypothetical protein
MKTVELFSDFDYRPHPRRTIRFAGGITYARVLELAAREIERKGAGRIVSPQDAAGDYQRRDLVDASDAFRPRKWRLQR